MKKTFLFVIAGIILLISSYFLLSVRPTTLTSAIKINAARNAVIRCLIERDKWEKWWPAHVKILRYPDDNFSIQQELLTRVSVLVNYNGKYQQSSININSVASDTSVAFWQFQNVAATNPLNFFSNSFNAKEVKKNMNAVFNALKKFAEDQENIYGLKIQQIKVKDSLLVSSTVETQDYPTTEKIYEQINELKQFIKNNDAGETDYPMMHIQKAGNKKYQLMIAIPVNKMIRDKGPVEFKRMVTGNLLVTEVVGGEQSIKKGMEEIENYLLDYNKTSPAIPFQMLVTDRLKQPDSTQWITRIFYPVI